MTGSINRRLAVALTLVIGLLLCAEARADEGDASLRSCIAAGAVAGCATDALLNNAYGVAVAPDGGNVYVTALNTNSVIAYSPNPSTGALTRLAGPSGCARTTPVGGDCQAGRSITFPSDLVVSPDGRNVYVAGYLSNGIAIFDRDPSSGALTQKAGAAGCVRSSAGEGCAVGRAITQPIGLTVSADGRNVYSLQDFGAIVVFDRDVATGAITQKAGEAGCINNNGASTCAVGRALGGFGSQLVLSPDGRHLYAPAPSAGGILLFNRDTTTGEIVQKAGTQGCITFNGSPTGAPAVNQCQDGSDNLAGTHSVIADPSGRDFYALTDTGIIGLRRDSIAGSLAQFNCITENLTAGCTDGTSLSSLWNGSFSPDGKDLVVGDNNSPNASGLRFLRRDPTTGALSQRATTARCMTSNGTGGGVPGACRSQTGFGGWGIPRYAPNGLFFYATQRSAGVIATMDRDFVPVCQSATVDVPHNTAVNVSLTCSDLNGDPITLEKVTSPTAGRLADTIDQAAGRIFYDPFSGFSGSDSFAFRGIARGIASAPATISLQIATAPPSGGGGGGTPQPSGIDNDKDGFFAGQDCNDGNAAIRPGAVEVKGNNLDENCDGLAEPFPTLTSGVASKWDVKGNRLTMTLLQVTQQFPKGWKVLIKCSGKPKCPFKTKTLKAGKVSKGASTVISSLSKKQRKFKAGQTVEVWVSAPNFNTKVARLALRKGKIPTTQPFCVIPGQTKPQKTCS